MKIRITCLVKYMILILVLFTGYNGILYSQTMINGIINKYGRVTSIGADYVVVTDASQLSQFHAGDTILLIQMKGVRIYAAEDFSFGSAGYAYGKPGKHEFLVIQSLESVTNKIVFRNNIINSGFDPNADVQIIKVPSYNFASVNTTLICQPWDSMTKTGGVLAVIIGRTLSLNANIDVTGKGFKGGAAAIGQGICITTDFAKWGKYAYSGTSDSSGFKGESLASRADPWGINTHPFLPVFPLFAKGMGKNFNGGGGGNGKFSGGGGGSNYGAGGSGGREINTCIPQYSGGYGGISITSTGLEGDLFPGGGGGGSTYISGGIPSAGANGGGIIILVCDTLKGNGYSILADGSTPSVTASGYAGSGGGGGGGSVAIYLRSFSEKPATSALVISASGGKGGNNAGTFGEGGGGGGGLINTNISPPANVTQLVFGGVVGTRSGGSTGGNGMSGSVRTTFAPVLNGIDLILTAIENRGYQKQFVIYPNPSGNETEIKLTDQRNGEIEIIISDMSGRRISTFTAQKADEEFTYRIPLSHLSSGVYQVQVILEKTIYFPGRLMVKK